MRIMKVSLPVWVYLVLQRAHSDPAVVLSDKQELPEKNTKYPKFKHISTDEEKSSIKSPTNTILRQKRINNEHAEQVVAWQ